MHEASASYLIEMLAALWLPSPTRQRVKLKTNFKPVTLKHDPHTKTERDIKSLLLRYIILL
ncbi:MAG: hypothetical protein CENE_02623 [Candidatus Celerinatantimonas neptuna]|nr:MAG: hypothetical protein CENE_02623 [Candidatus Celerinatantimonas neptuna]